MSTLSELLPSGGGGGSTVDFVASGTLPNGIPVILKADGTVEAVSGSTITESIPAGTKAVFDTSSCTHVTSAVDPHNTNKFIVAYLEDLLDGIVVVGTISGTSITFGSEQEFHDGKVEYISVAFDPNTANKFVVSFRDINDSNKGRIRVGTISGTSVTYGTETNFNNNTTEDTSISFDPNTADKFVVAYQTFDSHGKALVGTVSGTSLSFGSVATFNPVASDYFGISFDPHTAGRFAICYEDEANSSYGTVILGTLSGTDITFGSEYVFNSGNSSFTAISFDPNTANKFVVCYRDGSNSNYATASVGTIANDVISYGTKYILNSGLIDWITVNFDHTTTGQFVVAFEDRGDANKGTAIVGQMASQTTNLTATNFVGTSTEAYTNAETATIAVQGGLSTNQTGLTIGSTYYVQHTGTLATTAGTPSVNAGKALSATTLLLKDL